MNRADLARFFGKVRVSPSGCWEWTGGPAGGSGAYGWFWLGHGKATTAHRAGYTAFVGPVPDGLELDHLCSNPKCCNPSHLEPVTALENAQRAVARRTHCRNGHPITAEHTIVRRRQGSLYRECRVCNRILSRNWMRAHRASLKAQASSCTAVASECADYESMTQEASA